MNITILFLQSSTVYPLHHHLHCMQTLNNEHYLGRFMLAEYSKLMIYIYIYIPVQSGQNIDGMQQNKDKVPLSLTSLLYHRVQTD